MGREVVFTQPRHRVQVPIIAGSGRVTPLVLGGIVSEGAEAGTYEVVIIQRQSNRTISGASTVWVHIGM